MIFAMNSQTFRRMVSIPLLISENATIRADENGLDITLVDTAHIMMAGLTIPRSAMSQYDEPETFTVDLKKLADIARLADKEEDIFVEVRDGRISLMFGPITRTCALVEKEAAPPRIPNIDYPCQLTIDQGIFAEAVRAVADVGDSVSVELMDDSRMRISSRQDIDYVEYVTEVPSCNGVCKSGYPTTYSQMIPRIAPSGTLIVDLGQDMPIRVSFDDGTMSGFAMMQPVVRSDEE